jgi:hypothetical protein
LARQADPENQRTLTVATKIDLCEKEHFVTQFKEMLDGNLGVAVVRNRKKEELEAGVTFDQIR